MIRALWDKLFGINHKRWEVYGHEVKKVEKIERGSAPSGMSDRVAGRTETFFRCVDCEKEKEDREQFEDEKCYERIQ